MIKKFNYLLAFAVFLAVNIHAQTTNVHGNIAGLKETDLVIVYYLGSDQKMDTIHSKNGKFAWKAKLPEPQKVGIMFPDRYVPFFAQQGDINIIGSADSLNKLKVSGSALQKEADAYILSLKDLTDQESAIFKRYDSASKDEQDIFEIKLTELSDLKKARADQYISQYPGSLYSVNLVADRAMFGDYTEVKAAFEKLDITAQQTHAGKRLIDRIAVLKRSEIGEQVYDFVQNDTLGNSISFKDFRGKYVLIDFWASWCGPCRAENPNVLKAYNRYKDKNFTVLGISLDEEGTSWKKAIVKDQLPWTQLSDLKGWKNAVSNYYGIRGIPSSLLVDPQGKIIAKNLRGEGLNKKLQELLDL